MHTSDKSTCEVHTSNKSKQSNTYQTARTTRMNTSSKSHRANHLKKLLIIETITCPDSTRTCHVLSLVEYCKLSLHVELHEYHHGCHHDGHHEYDV